MYFHRAIRALTILLVLVYAPLGCNGGDGLLGDQCRSFGSFCDPNLRCVDDICVACGGDGQICCSDPGGGLWCLDGGSCNGTVDQESYFTCTNTCGTVGKPCCGENSCPGDMSTCGPDGVCATPATSVCAGGTQHSAQLINSFGCGGDTYTFWAQTPDDVQTCAAELLAHLDPSGQSHLEIDAELNCTDVCATSFDHTSKMQYSLCALPQDLMSCEGFVCGNCHWDPGTCTP